MKKIAFYDTSIFTYNIGDQIIMESVERELIPLFKNDFILKVPTHTPICHFYEFLVDKIFKKNNVKLSNSDYSFVCGTNLLTGNMAKVKNNWNINIFDSLVISDAILVGVGHNINSKKINFYTKNIYKNVLSKNYVHSVRDESTKKFLEEIGFKAINTGCCTLWMLTKEHCKKIKQMKSENVVFTLTDYSRNYEKDEKLIEILKKNYSKIYFFPQGLEDVEYLNSFKNIDDIIIIEPSLNGYSKFLETTDCDYIGTRLHGGIKAMQKFKRSIIISIDNRARNMGSDYNLNIVERDNIDELDNIINKKIRTDIKIDYKKINDWKSQFE